jgi:hypothetical protein
MILFVTSIGALFYTINCISAADDVDNAGVTVNVGGPGGFYDFAAQTDYGSSTTPSSGSCVAEKSAQNKYACFITFVLSHESEFLSIKNIKLCQVYLHYQHDQI